jgi:netrin-G3 ligand
LRIEPVKLSDANNTISCTAENGIGSPVKAEATIQVLSRGKHLKYSNFKSKPSLAETPVGFPVIEAHPVMKSVESGRTAHLSCRVQGVPTPKLLWLKNSIPGKLLMVFKINQTLFSGRPVKSTLFCFYHG